MFCDPAKEFQYNLLTLLVRDSCRAGNRFRLLSVAVATSRQATVLFLLRLTGSFGDSNLVSNTCSDMPFMEIYENFGSKTISE